MPHATCVICDAVFECEKPWSAKYCSPTCKTRSRVKRRACAHCGGIFDAIRANSYLRRKTGDEYIRTCSKQCAQLHRAAQLPARPPTCPIFKLRVHGCLSCDVPITGTRKWCSSCYRTKDRLRLKAYNESVRAEPVSRSVRCRRCGSEFSTTWEAKLYCSRACRKGADRDRRRMLKRNAYVEDVWRSKVYERDGWKCQLCGKALKRDAVVPHPKAPTLDHIIPLSKGGTHEYANVQAAHFICNSIKSDGGTDQLRLAV